MNGVNKNTEVKFQLSFRYLVKDDGFLPQMFVAYTGTNYWQTYAWEESAPFRTTDHTPELFFEWIENALFARIARSVLGDEVALYRAVLWNKAAQTGMNLPWHQDDGRFWGLDRAPSLQIWTALDDASVRQRLASFYTRMKALELTSYRTLTAISQGATPGPQSSLGKLVGAPKTQDMASFAIDLMEMSGAIWDDEFAAEAGMFQAAYMGIPGLRIAGGTDEIMANIIAERVLGLPQEPRMDKGIPFSEVPTGS